MRAYLLLRLRILGRQLAELGWLRLVLLGGMLLVSFGKLLELLMLRPAGQWALPVLGGLMCWSGHRRRTDLTFLQVASPRYRQWLAAEYGLWLLPCWLPLLALGNFGAALAALAAPVLVPLLPAGRTRATRRPRRSLFRSEAFEWVSGFRQTGGWLVWAAGLAVAGWQHASIVPALALGGWGLFTTLVYAIPEPSTMVTSYGRSAAAFQRRKLLLGAGLYGLTAVPFFLLAGTSPAGWAGASALLVWGLLVLSMSVMAKYAFYPHATLVRLTQSMAVTAAVLPLLNAAYAPIFVAVFLGLIWKSRQRLMLYWHA